MYVNGEEEYAYKLSTHPPTTIDHFVLLDARSGGPTPRAASVFELGISH